jgi:hypothetical protein
VEFKPLKAQWLQYIPSTLRSGYSFFPNVLKQFVFVTLMVCVFCEVGNVPFVYRVLHPNLRLTELNVAYVHSFMKIGFVTCGQERSKIRAMNE